MARGGNVDERIVDMQFNNRQFEAGVSDTLGTLDKLKDGLKDLDKSSGGFAGMEAGIAGLSAKFSALEMAAFAAIANIVNRFIDGGIEIAKSLTIEPITTGWSKYEQKVAATQTIMNATGESIEVVQAKLEGLNTFVDETSYSFSDMVTNIGKFTGAGIALDDATTSMQGIATWAALSGQATAGASHAMGIMAKSIGSGALSLREWRQLETLNMTTVEFKQSLLDAAVAAGTLTKTGDKYTIGLKDAEVTIGNFSENLKDGWVNAEVMQNVLTEYGNYANFVLARMEKDNLTAAQAMAIMAGEGANLDIVFQKMVAEGVDAATAMELLKAEGIDLGPVLAKAAEEGITAAEALEKMKAEGRMSALFMEAGGAGAEKLTENLTAFVDKGQTASQVLELMASKGLTAKDAIKELKKQGVDVNKILGKFQKKGESTEQALARIAQSGVDASEALAYAEEHAVDLETAISELSTAADAIPDGATLETLGSKAFRAAQEAKTLTDALAAVKDAVATKWMTSFEHIFGNFEEARELWSEVADILWDIFASGGDARNEMLEAWKELGGQKHIANSITNALKALADVLTVIKAAWQSIFPPKTAEELAEMTAKMEAFTESLVSRDEEGEIIMTPLLEAITTVVKGLASALDIVIMAFKGVWQVIKGVLGVLQPLWDLLGGVALSIFEWVTGLRDAIKEGNKFGEIAQKIVDFIQRIWDALAAVFSGELTVGDFFKKVWGSIVDGFNWIKQKLFGGGEGEEGGEGGIFAALGQALKDGWEWFKGLFSKIQLGPELEEFFQPLVDAFDWIKGKIDGWNIGGKLRAVWQGLVDAFEWLRIHLFGGTPSEDAGERMIGPVGEFLINFFEKIGAAIEWVRSQWEKWDIGGKLKAIWEKIVAALDVVKKWLFGEAGGEDGEGTPGALSKLFTKIGEAFAWVKGKFQQWDIGGKLKAIWDKIISVFNTVKTWAFGDGAGTVGAVQRLWQKFVDAWAVIKPWLFGDGAGSVGMFKKIWGGIVDAFNWLKATLFGSGDSDSIGFFTKAWEKIKEVFAAIKSIFSGDGLDGGEGGLTVGEGVKNVLGWVGTAINWVIDALKNIKLEDLMAIAKEVLKVLMMWKTMNLIGAMGDFFDNLASLAKGTGKKDSFGTAMLKFAAAVAILAAVVHVMANMEVSKALKGIAFMALIIVLLAAAMKYTEGVKVKGALGMALAVGVLVFIIKKVAEMLDSAKPSVGALIGAVIAVGALMLALSYAMKLSGENMKFTSGMGVLLFVLSLKLLIGAVKTMVGMIDEIGYVKLGMAMLAVSALLLALTAAAHFMGSGMKASTGVGFILFAVALRMLVGVVKDIANNMSGSMVAAMDMVILLMAALAAVAWAVAQATKGADTASMAAAIFVMIGIAYAVGELVKSVKAIDIKEDWGGLLGVGALMAALLLAIKAITKTAEAAKGNMLRSFGAVLLMAAFLATIIGALYFLNEMDFEGMEKKLLMVGAMMLGLIAVAYAAAGLGALGVTGVIGAGVLALIEGVVALGVWLAGVVLEDFTSRLPSIGESLSTFATNADGFFTWVSGITEDTVKAVGYILQIVTKLTGQAFLDSLAKLVGGDVVNFAENTLVPLSEALVKYSTIVQNVDDEAMNKSTAALDLLIDAVNKLEKEGGSIDAVEGTISQAAKNFAGTLIELGTGIKDYAEQVTGISLKDTLGSAMAIYILTSAAAALGKEGGTVDATEGTVSQSFKTFSADLPALGTNIMAYASAIDGINLRNVLGSAMAIKILAGAAATLGPSGGLSDFVYGDTVTTMTAFAGELQTLGKSIKAYSDEVKDFNKDDVDASTAAISVLAEAANNLPDAQSWISKLWSGDQSLSAFGKELASFGADFRLFSVRVSLFDAEKTSAVITVLGEIVTFGKTLLENTNATFEMGTFGSALGGLGTAINTFAGSMSDVTPEQITNAKQFIQDIMEVAKKVSSDDQKLDKKKIENWGDAIKALAQRLGKNGFWGEIYGVEPDKLTAIMSLIDQLMTIGKDIEGADFSGFASFAEGLKGAGDLGVAAFIKVFSDATIGGEESLIEASTRMIANAAIAGISYNLDEYKTTGIAVVTNYTAGILAEGNQLSAELAGKAVSAEALKGVVANLAEFTTAGENAGQGFIDGILSKVEAAKVAGASLGGGALEGVSGELDLGSPSKELHRYGVWGGKGLIGGLESMIWRIRSTGEGMGRAIKNPVTEALKRLPSLLEQDIKMEPVIRPVIDLTNVQNGTNKLNRMFEKSPAFSLSSNMDNSKAILGEIARRRISENQITSLRERPGTVVNWNQEFTSPKALSRLEIYRQNKNQFAQLQQLVGERKTDR